jgi:hypothetical protein
MSDEAAIKQLENALALQKKAFLKNQCPSVEERKANVGKVPGMVLANRDAIREAMSKDFGSHPKALTDIVEILGVAGRAAYVISQLDKWTAVDTRDVDAQMYGSAKGEVRYQPKGVIGNIVRMYAKRSRDEYVSLTVQRGTSLLISRWVRSAKCWRLVTESSSSRRSSRQQRASCLRR